jgi:hypothetical protein
MIPKKIDDQVLKREFIRHLAYLCNHNPGNDRVTAIALGGSVPGVTYRFTSNKVPDGLSLRKIVWDVS